MLDRFMELTLPFWLTLSGLFAVGAGVLLVQAASRLRQLRMLLDEASRRRSPADAAPPPSWPETQDWVPVP